jgi:hypothetical protein
LAAERRAFGFDLLQVECAQLASYGSDVLVEHDVTFDLFGRIARRDGTLSSGWDYWRWLRMERRVTTRYRRVVMMWEKDAKLPVSVLSPNGPGTTCCSSVRSGISRTWRTGFSPSTSGPLLRDKFPEMRLTVVCRPDYLPCWRTSASLPEPLSMNASVCWAWWPICAPSLESNLVLVPTTALAGTNIKVLVAMAIGRVVVSASSGSAGLGLSMATTRGSPTCLRLLPPA